MVRKYHKENKRCADLPRVCRGWPITKIGCIFILLIGQALVRLGHAEEELNGHQVRFANQTKDGWLSGLQRAIDEHKEYAIMKKKLESRRSDYDSKQAKLQKSRKDTVILEDDVRTAQVRYEDTHEDVTRRMVSMKEAEHVQLQELAGFYEAQLAYHSKCFESLKSLRGSIGECLEMSTTISRKNTVTSNHSLGTKRSGLALHGSTGSPRQGIPFGRTDSQQNGSSSQFSNGSFEDPQQQQQQVAQYDYAHGIDTPVDTGALDGSMTLPHSAARQLPQLTRVQSDMSVSSSGSVRRPAPPPPPPVAPRRHAPAPPMPVRPPSRKLRRAVYKFAADEEGELPMERGDVVEVTDKLDEGWWHGRIVHSSSSAFVGRIGLFPTNYTEDCSESDIPQKPPMPARPSTVNNARQQPHSGSQDPFQQTLNPLPAHRSQTTPGMSAPSPHQRMASGATNQGAETAARPECACGCKDYSPNLFKKNTCTNCFHAH